MGTRSRFKTNPTTTLQTRIVYVGVRHHSHFSSCILHLSATNTTRDETNNVMKLDVKFYEIFCSVIFGPHVPAQVDISHQLVSAGARSATRVRIMNYNHKI
jgi:hypothetical protein